MNKRIWIFCLFMVILAACGKINLVTKEESFSVTNEEHIGEEKEVQVLFREKEMLYVADRENAEEFYMVKGVVGEEFIPGKILLCKNLKGKESTFVKENVKVKNFKATAFPAFFEVLKELEKKDSALLHAIRYLGFDLSRCGLSRAEQKLLIHLYSKEKGLAFVEGSFNELAQAGYINKEKLYWEDGVLITFFKAKEDGVYEGKLWRSGLGAYFITFELREKEDSFEVHILSEAIS